MSVTLVDGDVELRTTTAQDAAALRAIRLEPGVHLWWDDLEDGFPMSDEPEAQRLTVRVGGAVAGMVQWWEESEPKYRHATIDVFLGSAHQGRGVGTRTLRLLLAHLRALGHHRVTIDPAVGNAPAVACYTRAGFTPVGVLRLAERDTGGTGWHDVLLMEHVRDPSA